MAEPKAHIEPQLYDDFLSELRALDEFRGLLFQRHPEAQLRRDDPDVRRLIEAIAYFSMRSRRQLLSNMDATWLRLFSEQFEPLITPLPAVAMVKAVVQQRRADVAVLPRSTELVLTSAQGHSASFRTLDELRLLPIELASAVLLHDPAGGYDRIAIELVGRFPRQDAVGLLRLHTRVMDDYAASATFLYQLRSSLLRAHVVYDGTRSIEQTGEPCQVSYGSDYLPYHGLGGGPSGGPETTPPLERVRAFFHFPERELFLNLKVPPPSEGGAWQRLIIYLDVKPGRMATRISADLFHLHAVPVCNLRREAAMPISCEGTQDAYPIRHPNPEYDYALRSVLGVYVARESGLVPLRSDLLTGLETPQDASTEAAEAGPSYHVEERLMPSGPRSFLVVRAPTALLQPLRLQVDALWHQPGFAEQCVLAGGSVIPTLASRVLEGVSWETLFAVRAAYKSQVRGAVSNYMRILSMSMRPVIKEADLRWFMNLLIGEGGPAVYRALPERLRELKWQLSPDAALRGSGVRHVYSAQLPITAGEDEALVWNFLRCVYEVLDAWNQESTIGLMVETGKIPLNLPIMPTLSPSGEPEAASSRHD